MCTPPSLRNKALLLQEPPSDYISSQSSEIHFSEFDTYYSQALLCTSGIHVTHARVSKLYVYVTRLHLCSITPHFPPCLSMLCPIL